MPPVSVDEQKWINYQQQPAATHFQPGQPGQQQQQLNYQFLQQQPWLQEKQMSHQQLQPTQLHSGKKQQFNYQLLQQQSMQLQHNQEEVRRLRVGGQQQSMQLQPRQQQHTQEEVRTLKVGGLQHWMDEAYLYYCFSHTFPVCSIQLIQSKLLGYSEGYGYVDFVSQAAAERALQSYNGFLMPHTQCQPFRLQWASSATRQISFRPKASPEYSPFEGDLAPGGVTDHGVMQEKPEEGPKYSLWEGDLALGFITDSGLLQEKPKEGPEYSPSEGNSASVVTDRGILHKVFRTPYQSAKQELVKVTIPGCSTWAGGPGHGGWCPWH